ncbi:thioredoxin-disulfide reductase [Clostridiales bacterium COT073_COT-073]|nr:thioredoxin-disulfide reductase [Clostridiales bacterium COT073_COT-073]
MNKIYDVAIIGAGPAGMTAGIYASRAQLDYILLEKGFAGGQIINTYEVENYTGFSSISGFDLAQKMQEHLQYLGGSITMAEIKAIRLTENGLKEVETESGSFLAKTLIIATGATARKLGVPGEEQFSGRGVSYCATCDGAFYKDKTTIVIGGGDVAVEDAIYLARMCKKVYIAHRRDEFRAVKNLQTKLLALPNVEVLWFTEAEEIKGNDFVNAISLVQNQTGEKTELAVDGVFIAVGSTPNTEFVGDLVEKDGQGSIITNSKCQTSVDGIYAAGDLRSGSVRQIMAACADAVAAVMDIDKQL